MLPPSNKQCWLTHRGYKYEKEIKLYNLKCKKLPKLRFIVQNKWWFNPHGKVHAVDVCTYRKWACSCACHNSSVGYGNAKLTHPSMHCSHTVAARALPYVDVKHANNVE
jgi:hypothetical protein